MRTCFSLYYVRGQHWKTKKTHQKHETVFIIDANCSIISRTRSQTPEQRAGLHFHRQRRGM